MPIYSKWNNDQYLKSLRFSSTLTATVSTTKSNCNWPHYFMEKGVLLLWSCCSTTLYLEAFLTQDDLNSSALIVCSPLGAVKNLLLLPFLLSSFPPLSSLIKPPHSWIFQPIVCPHQDGSQSQGRTLSLLCMPFLPLCLSFFMEDSSYASK